MKPIKTNSFVSAQCNTMESSQPLPKSLASSHLAHVTPFLQVFQSDLRHKTYQNLTETPAKRESCVPNGSLQDFCGGAGKTPLNTIRIVGPCFISLSAKGCWA